MAIDFPNSPSVNDTFTVGNRVWQWDGTTWNLFADSSIVTLTGTQTLTNKTLQTPKLIGPIESWRLGSSSTFFSSPPMDIYISSAYLAQVTATNNVTLNVRWSSAVSLNSYLATGNAVTVAYAHTNGATAYMPTTFQIDGVVQTPIWQGGTAPASGNANCTDVYVYTIIKTGAATFRVLASQTKFA